MIRVLHVINWLRRGGVETQLLQILRDYDRSRFHIDVGCFGTDDGGRRELNQALRTRR